MNEDMMNMTPEEASEHLEHHGIPGMKWGVRRYQNRDGSLTAEGRKRRGLSEKPVGEKIKKLAKGVQEKRAAKKAAKEATQKEDLKRYIRDHPKQLYRKRYDLSKEELAQLVDDINFDRKLKDVRDQEYQRDWDKVKTMAGNLGTIKQFADNAKGIYNLAAEVNNTLVDTGKMNGKKMTKIGEKAPEDHSAIDKLIRTGTAEEIQKAYKEGKLSPKDMSNVNLMRDQVSKFEEKNFKNQNPSGGVTDSVGSSKSSGDVKSWYDASSGGSGSGSSKGSSDWYKTSTDKIDTKTIEKSTPSVGSASSYGDWYKTGSSASTDSWYKPSADTGSIKVSDISKYDRNSSGKSGGWYSPTASKLTPDGVHYYTDYEKSVIEKARKGHHTPAGVHGAIDDIDPGLGSKWQDELLKRMK